MRKFKESYAVTGYVSDETAQRLMAQDTLSQYGTIEVKPERNRDEVVMRVAGDDVTSMRTGVSVDGETLVQLILRDSATVETTVKTRVDVEGLHLLADPTLARLTAAATAKKIMV